MTDPIRAALERLIDRLNETTDPSGPVPAWSDSFYAARAALAQSAPPAEGEVGELVDWLRSSACYHDAVNDEEEAAAGCRRAPVQQEPPADFIGNEKGFAQEHLARLMRDAIGNETNHNAYIVAAGKILDRPEFAYVAQSFARAVLAKYGTTPVPTPVPVSERLPEPEDCDAMGRCWWFCPPDFMELRSHATAESAFVAGATHWLPANSLPLPAGEVQP